MFYANRSSKTLDFSFNLASKGGGITAVNLQIGIADLPVILNDLAIYMPESAGMLSECAAIATKKNMEMLNVKI